jgi:DNA-binding NarL/FixJ family response regulator
MPLRILLAAECEPVRRNIETLLGHDGGEIVCFASDAPGVIEVARAMQPDVAVLDLELAPEETLVLARELRSACRAVRMIVVQGDPRERDVVAVFRAGIGGVVLRGRIEADLARAVREVARGELFLSPCASHTLVEAHVAPTLSAASSRDGESRPRGAAI